MIYVLLNSEVPLAKSTAKNSLKIENTREETILVKYQHRSWSVHNNCGHYVEQTQCLNKKYDEEYRL